MKKTFLSAVALSAFAFVGCQDADFTSPVETADAVEVGPKVSLGVQFVEGDVLVKFKSSNAGRRSSLLASIGGQVQETIMTDAMETSANMRGAKAEPVLLVKASVGTRSAIEILKNSGEVEYAEPNYIYQHNAVSNDTYFTNGSLWGMGAAGNQFGSRANEAWAAGKTGSSSVYIGIIDEGYMYSHPDLAANAGVNPGEVANNGIDDDGNGYVDDVYGFDFAGNDKEVFDGAGDDHGTHCAGTIGGVGGNGTGVAGVVWNVKMLSGKFLGNRGGTTANAIKAVDYFTDMKQRHGLNIVATSNSWGGGGYSQALYDAIERANQAGILFVAAAGNSGTNNDATPSYPASYANSNIIAVASITNTGALSSFSQYGASSVDIGAPGSGIWSTVPKSSKGKVIATYASYNGTSMATPHVSGAVALYASLNPGASAAQIKNAILSSATPTASLAGKCVTGGRLNVSGF